IADTTEGVVSAAKSRPALEVELVPLAPSFEKLFEAPPSSSLSDSAPSGSGSSSAPDTPGGKPGESRLPELCLFCRGPAVLLWQRIVNRSLDQRGIRPLLEIDGDFGPLTSAATLLVYKTKNVTAETWGRVRL